MRKIFRRNLLTVIAGMGLSLSAASLGQGQYCPVRIMPPCQPLPPAPCPSSTPAAPPMPAPEKPPEKPPEPPPVQPPVPAPAAPAPDESLAQAPSSDDIAPGGEMLAMFDSSVGYIDSAIPASQLRARYDSAYKNNRPNRAEFFYAKGAPTGPGLPLPETSVDYETLEAYLEYAFSSRFSGFFTAPARFLSPEVNTPEDGFGDLDTGFKYAFQRTADAVTTFQLRAFAPTGNPNRGLGTNHVSLEPALLMYRKLSDRIRYEGEFRYWVPIGGTDFAGDVIRYGAGLSYGERPPDKLWLTPVAEIVGWTVLSGKESATFFPGATPVVMNAAGDTIVNAKAGVRVGCGERANLYFGYGRALTGDVWYKNLYRLEFRLAF